MISVMLALSNYSHIKCIKHCSLINFNKNVHKNVMA